MPKPTKDHALYMLDLPYCCGGVVLEKRKGLLYVKEAAPIFSWMVGKAWPDIKHWVTRKRGTCTLTPYTHVTEVLDQKS